MGTDYCIIMDNSAVERRKKMKKDFGKLPDGSAASLYTISRGGITAQITDLGATLVRLWVPDEKGNVADVVLGYDDAASYVRGENFFGATVGRYANRIGKSTFPVGDKVYHMTPNENDNNLHSGPDYFKDRIFAVESVEESSICLRLDSPDGDQGFPGNAVIRVTYSLEADKALKITYDAVCDKDTIFNLTNHSYFNMAGHDQPEKGGKQLLSMPARFYVAVDDELIPTGELTDVAGTAMDFRTPRPIDREDGPEMGYDHTFEVFTAPGAILSDPESGRTMAVITDCPGVQLYTSVGMDVMGKDGVHYGDRSGICLETQYYPDSVNHPQWPQPLTKAGERYRSQTIYKFN